MSPLRIRTVALTSSLILHAIPLVWGLLTFSTGFDMPEIELEFTEVEIIDPDLLQGDVEEVPEEAAVVEPPAEAEAEDDGDENGEEEPEPLPEDEAPAEEKPPKPGLGDKAGHVAELAPTTSTLYLLLANERIRRLSFGYESVEIMAPLPDFQFIIQGGGFDPLRDFDYMVIATPDVRDVTQTFLAVEYNLPQAHFRAGLERAVAAQGQAIEWVQRNGYSMGNPRPIAADRPDTDPRWVVFLEDDLAVYVREEFLDSIITDASSAPGKTSGSFVANLVRIRRFAAAEPRAGMQAVLKDLRSALKRVRGLPFAVPDDIQITAEAAESPRLVIRHRFLSNEDAEQFAQFWHEEIPKIIDSDWKIKTAVGWLYDLVELERDGTTVVLRGKFSRDQAETILQLLADFSRKALGKTPEEMEQDRLERERAWNERNGAPTSSKDPSVPEGVPSLPDVDDSQAPAGVPPANDQGPADPVPDQPDEEAPLGSPLPSSPLPPPPDTPPEPNELPHPDPAPPSP